MTDAVKKKVPYDRGTNSACSKDAAPLLLNPDVPPVFVMEDDHFIFRESKSKGIGKIINTITV